VQSSNYPRTQLPLAQVRCVEVSQYQPVQTTLAVTALSLAASLIVLAALR
jgi:hypothetical protein